MKRLEKTLIICLLLCFGVGVVLLHGSENSTSKPPPKKSSEIWKDPRTGLMWQVNPTGDRMSWRDARVHCRNLSLDGYSDWRLPTISEARSMIRGCPATQSDGECDVEDSCLKSSCWNKPCEGCPYRRGRGSEGAYWPPKLSGKSDWYWSSSRVLDSNEKVWFLEASFGGVYPAHVNLLYRTRCVHSQP